MASIKDLVQSADCKVEKHMPVIDAPGVIKKGEAARITISVGRHIPHPNKTEHHIRWISAYFHPDGEKFPYNIARAEFSAHGESTQGPDTSTVYTNPEVVISLKTEKSGTLYAMSYCNIHGFWENSHRIEVK